MITTQEAKRLAKKNLSEKRYQHTLAVSKLACKLAQNNGVSEEKAMLAALLHDLMKEQPRAVLLQIFQDDAIIGKTAPERPAAVWHGLAAAIVAKTQYGVEDAEILSAIACHTTGKANMSTLDKIIYMADMAGEDRTYPEAAALRKLATEQLDRATVEGLGMSIAWLKQEGKAVDTETLEAYASLRKRYYGGE